MEFELSEEHRMLKDLVNRFVADELMPLEAGVLAREAAGQGMFLAEAEHKRIDEFRSGWACGDSMRRPISEVRICRPWR
jgi:hypothetical protein